MAGTANRFHTSERVIDTILVIEGMRHERVAAALRNGLVTLMKPTPVIAMLILTAAAAAYLARRAAEQRRYRKGLLAQLAEGCS
jgi:hypothetical protein